MPATEQIVRQIALALPGVTEGQSYGTPSWHVGTKMMVRLRDDGETLVVKVDFAARDRLLDEFPDVFYLTDHYRAYQNVLVRLEAVGADRLRQVIEGAWRMVASRRQIVAWDAAPSAALPTEVGRPLRGHPKLSALMDEGKRQETGRKIIRHDLPPWVDPDASDFFITICCQRRGGNQLCLPRVAESLLASARFYYEQNKWFPYVFLLMPDHLHLIVGFGRDCDMEKTVAAWKRFTARQYRTEWQEGFFEHRLRRDESWEEKAIYILNNPVRAGLVAEGEAWPYVLKVDQITG